MITKSDRHRYTQIAFAERWRVVVAEHFESHGHRYIPILDRRGRRRCGRCKLLRARARTAADPVKAAQRAALARERRKARAVAAAQKAETDTLAADLLRAETKRRTSIRDPQAQIEAEAHAHAEWVEQVAREAAEEHAAAVRKIIAEDMVRAEAEALGVILESLD